MGWAWFIPTFHMPQPPPSTSTGGQPSPTIFKLEHKDIDFAIGIGGDILDVEVTMEWIPSPGGLGDGSEAAQPPSRVGSGEEIEATAGAGAGVAAAAALHAAGKGVDIGEVVEATQAAAD